jgi:transcriptional regulator with XRE-family HTH domain
MISRNSAIKKALENAEVTQDKLAKRLGISRAAVGERLNGEKDIDSVEFIQAVADLTGKPFQSFLKDDGLMVAEQLVPYLSGKVIRPITVTVDRAGKELITYVPVRARAGYLGGYGDPQYIQKLPAFNLPVLKDGTSYRMFEAQGESMLQLGGGGIHDGDVVIGQYVEDFYAMRDRRVYVLITTDGIIIKRVINRLKDKTNPILVCQSDNKNGSYKDIIIRPTQILEIWELSALISKQLGFATDIWELLNNMEARMAEMDEKIEKINIERLNP